MINNETPQNEEQQTQTITNPSSRTNTPVDVPLIADQEDFTEQDIITGNFFKQFLPGRTGHNPTSILNDLRSDPSLVSEVANNVLEQQLGDRNPDEFFEENNTTREATLSKIQKNIHNTVTQTAYSGEEVRKSLRSGLEKTKKEMDLTTVNGAQSLIEKNAKQFGGLVNKDGKLDMNETAFRDLFNNDQQLQQQVLDVKLNEFNEQLTNKHNAGIIDPSMANRFPKRYAEAFAIFDRFGKEGLTDYINFFQETDTDVPFEEQSRFARKAIRFLNSPTQDGQTPLEYAKSVVNNTEFKPITPKKSKPAIHNGFTAPFIDGHENEEIQPGTRENDALAVASLIEKVGQKETETTGQESSFFGEFVSNLTSFNDKERMDELQDNIAVDDLKGFIADNDIVTPEDLVHTLFDEDTNSFNDSATYDNFLRLFSKQLLDDEHEDVKVADLFKTIQVHAFENNGFKEDEEGNPLYEFDYDSAPAMVKLATDLLTYRNGLDMFVRNSEDGEKMVLEPNRIERLQDEATRRLFSLADIQEVERVFDDEGNVVQERVVRDRVGQIPTDEPLTKREGNVERSYVLNNDILTLGGAVWNTGTVALNSVTSMLNDFVGKTFFRLTGEGSDFVEAMSNGIQNGEFKSKGELRQFSDQMVQDIAEITQSTYAPNAGLTSIQQATQIVAPLVSSIFLFKGMGRPLNKALGKQIDKSIVQRVATRNAKHLSGIRKATNLQRAKMFLKPPKNASGAGLYKASELRLRKLASGLKQSNSGTAQTLDFVAGGALYNIINELPQDEFSDKDNLLGSGLVDLGNDVVFDYDTDVEGWFKNLGDKAWYAPLMRIGVNVLAEETLGILFDSVIGGARFGKNSLFKLAGQEFSGLRVDPQTGKPIKTDQFREAFSPDYRRFIEEMRTGLAEMPRKDLESNVQSAGQAIAKSVQEDQVTMDDLASDFVTNIKPLVKDLKGQMRDTITEYEKNVGSSNTLFGNERGDVLNADSIDLLSESFTKLFWKNVSANMAQIMDGKGYNKFINALRDLEEVDIEKKTNSGGAFQMSKAEAVDIASDIPNSRVQQVTVNGKELYEVMEIKPNEWIADLVEGMRANAGEVDKQRELNRFLASERTGDLESNSRANDFFEEHFGEQRVFDGRRGTIRSIIGDQFVLQDIDGRLFRAPVDATESRVSKGKGENTPEADLASVKADISDGKVFFEQNVKKIGEVNFDSPSSVRNGIRRVEDRIVDLNRRANAETADASIKSANEREIKELNKVVQFLENQLDTTKGRKAQKIRLKKVDENTLRQEAEKAEKFLNNRFELNLNDRANIASVMERVDNQLVDLRNRLNFGKESNRDALEKQIDERINASLFLQQRLSDLDATNSFFEDAPPGVRRWLTNDNDDLIDINDSDAIQQRIQTLNGLKEDPNAQNTIRNFNEPEIDSAIDRLSQRLQTLEQEGLTRGEVDLKAKTKELKTKTLELERQTLLERIDKNFGSALDKITKITSKNIRQSYRKVVNKAKKTDPTLQETGLQGRFVENVGYSMDELEPENVLRVAGGSMLTDYNQLNGGRAIRKFNPKKPGKKGDIFYTENPDGTVDYIRVNEVPTHPNGGLDETIPTDRFIEINGQMKLNPFYQRISPNELTTTTGALQRVRIAQVQDPFPDFSGKIVEVGEGSLVANVQRSMRKTADEVVEPRDVYEGQFDGIEFVGPKGRRFIKLISKDQLKDVSEFKDTDITDTSKLEKTRPTDSYITQGANPPVPLKQIEPQTVNKHAQQVIVDLRSNGFENARIEAEINSKLETPVNGATKEYDPDTPAVQTNDLEVGDYFSLRDSDGNRRNAKHTGTKNGNFAYRLVKDDGSLGKEQTFNTSGVDKSYNIVERDGKFMVAVQSNNSGRILKLRRDLASTSRETVESYLQGVRQVRPTPGIPKIHKPFAMATAGLGIMVAEEALDIDLNEFETQEASLFSFQGVLGALIVGGLLRKGFQAYTPRAYRKVATLKKGFVDSIDDTIDPSAVQTLRKGEKETLVKEAQSRGVLLSPDDPIFSRFNQNVRDILESGNGLQEATRKMVQNKFVQSTFSMAQRSGVQSVMEFSDFLTNLPAKIQQMRNSFGDEFNEKHGVNAFNTFLRVGPEILDEFVPDQITTSNGTRQLRGSQRERSRTRAFNESLDRLMNSKLEFNEDGTARIVETQKSVDQQYNSPNGRTFQKIDEKMLNDERVVDAIKSMRNRFKELASEHRTLLNGFERQETSRVWMTERMRTVKSGDSRFTMNQNQYQILVDDFFLKFKGTWDEYIQTFDDKNVKKVLKNAKRFDPAVKRLDKIRDVKLRFTEGLEEFYYPQMSSRSKIGRARKEMGEENFEAELRQSFMDLNAEDDAVKKYDPDTQKVKTFEFETQEKAILHLKNAIGNSQRVPREAQQAFERNFGAFTDDNFTQGLLNRGVIKEVVKETPMGDGRVRKVKRFVIEDSDDNPLTNLQGDNNQTFNVIRLANNKEYDDFYDLMLTGDFVKNSSFLENPRNFLIDQRWRETDPSVILDRYAGDVAKRIEALKFNILDETELGKKFNKMESDLLDTGFRQSDARSHVERMKTAYNEVFRIIPELANFSTAKQKKDFLDRKLRNQQISEGIRNLFYGRYATSIALLDTFQTFITTSQLTSFKDVMRVLGRVAPTNNLSNLIQNSEELGVVFRQVEAMLADFDDAPKHAFSSDDPALNFVGGFNSFSRSLSRFWTQKFDVPNLVPKQLRESPLGSLTENAGIKLTLGNLRTKNEVNLTMNWMAHMTMLNDLVKNWRQIRDGNGIRGVSRGDVQAQFEMLGIARSEIDDVVDRIPDLNERLTEAGRNGKRFLSSDMDPLVEDVLERVIIRATETYTGKNQMFRPEWHNPTARVATTFWNFSFNQSMQTVERRFLNPLRSFTDKHPEASSKTNLMYNLLATRFMSPKKRRARFKKLGWSDQAIDDLPFRSLDSFVRLVGASGLNKMFTWSMDSMRKFASLAVLNFAFDDDSPQDELNTFGFTGRGGVVESLNIEDITLNANDSVDDQVRIGDAKHIKDMASLMMYMYGMEQALVDGFVNAGYGGPLAAGMHRFNDPTPAGISMISGDIAGVARFLTGVMEDDRSVERVGFNVAQQFIPPLGLLDSIEYEE